MFIFIGRFRTKEINFKIYQKNQFAHIQYTKIFRFCITLEMILKPIHISFCSAKEIVRTRCPEMVVPLKMSTAAKRNKLNVFFYDHPNIEFSWQCTSVLISALVITLRINSPILFNSINMVQYSSQSLAAFP